MTFQPQCALDHPPVMRGDGGVDQIAPHPAQSRQGSAPRRRVASKPVDPWRLTKNCRRRGACKRNRGNARGSKKKIFCGADPQTHGRGRRRARLIAHVNVRGTYREPTKSGEPTKSPHNATVVLRDFRAPKLLRLPGPSERYSIRIQCVCSSVSARRRDVRVLLERRSLKNLTMEAIGGLSQILDRERACLSHNPEHRHGI